MKRIGERGKRRKESKTRKREGEREKGVTVNIKNEKRKERRAETMRGA